MQKGWDQMPSGPLLSPCPNPHFCDSCHGALPYSLHQWFMLLFFLHSFEACLHYWTPAMGKALCWSLWKTQKFITRGSSLQELTGWWKKLRYPCNYCVHWTLTCAHLAVHLVTCQCYIPRSTYILHLLPTASLSARKEGFNKGPWGDDIFNEVLFHFVPQILSLES